MDNPQTSPDAAQHMNRAAHARMARLTQGLSPVSMVNAFTDWLTHLAIAPGKRQELATRAFRQWARLSQQMLNSMDIQSEPCVEPLPQDRRFAAAAWRQWAYNLIYQSFLLNQQWWHCATAGVPGITHHHEQQVIRTLEDAHVDPETSSASVPSHAGSGVAGVAGMAARSRRQARFGSHAGQ